MTLEAQNFGSEYGIEAVDNATYSRWAEITKPGEGFEGLEEAKTHAVKLNYEANCALHFRIVVYEYDGLLRKNIRVVTTIS